MTHTLTTTATWIDPETGEDMERDVTVTYTHYAGWDGGSHAESPPEPASIEIQSVTTDIPLEVWDTLIEECFEDYAAYLDHAAEYRWEMRNER